MRSRQKKDPGSRTTSCSPLLSPVGQGGYEWGSSTRKNRSPAGMVEGAALSFYMAPDLVC